MVLGLEKDVAHVAFDLAVRRVGKHTTAVKREDLEHYSRYQFGDAIKHEQSIALASRRFRTSVPRQGLLDLLPMELGNPLPEVSEAMPFASESSSGDAGMQG